MKEKSLNTARLDPAWLDPDEAPDLSELDPADFVWKKGEQVVTKEEGLAAFRALAKRGRPAGSSQTTQIALRVNTEVLEVWRASGKGWQTRVAALLAKHAPRAAS